MNRDFQDMLSALSAAGAEYLLVGGYALAVHGVPRATGDIDLWVRPTPANADRVMAALRDFGAPLSEVTRDDFARPGITFQIGLPPNRIDLLTQIDGVTFDDAWRARGESLVGGLGIPVLSREHLIQNKRATGRPRDLADLASLEDG